MNTLNPYIKISYCHKDVIKIVMSLKQPKNVHRELALLDSYQILKTLENQELINTVTKDAKYVKNF